MTGIFIYIIICIVFFLGALTSSKLIFLNEKKKKKKLKQKENDFFRFILNSIDNGRTKFLYRFFNTVYIELNDDKEGNLIISYFMDEKVILVLKNKNDKHSSSDIDDELKNDLIKSISNFYRHEINDIINAFGFIVSKKKFEENINMKIEDLELAINRTFRLNSESPSYFKDTHQEVYDIDEILDKINENGIKSLTKSERDYLKKYSEGEI